MTGNTSSHSFLYGFLRPYRPNRGVGNCGTIKFFFFYFFLIVPPVPGLQYILESPQARLILSFANVVYSFFDLISWVAT